MVRVSEELIRAEEDLQYLLDTFWRPYGQAVLRAMLEETDRLFGVAEQMEESE